VIGPEEEKRFFGRSFCEQVKEFILNQPALEVPMLGPWVRKHEVGFVDYKVGWKEFNEFLCLNLKEKKVFERTFGDFGLSFFNPFAYEINTYENFIGILESVVRKPMTMTAPNFKIDAKFLPSV
tara:strand:+ start:7474 stop:7845 length:372 start_codon:yes stop_codon:yes gene_type:complete